MQTKVFICVLFLISTSFFSCSNDEKIVVPESPGVKANNPGVVVAGSDEKDNGSSLENNSTERKVENFSEGMQNLNSESSLTPITNGSTSGIRINPSNGLTTVGETVAFSVYNEKNENISSSVQWTSGNVSIATSSGSGVFLGKKPGVISVQASYKGKTISGTLRVERPGTLADGIRYSRLVFGIENCAEAGQLYRGCLGADCDDAWVIINGDLSLGTYNNNVYIISNKKQLINITTYAGNWNYAGHSEDEINPDASVLIVTIKDRTEKQTGKSSLKMRNRGQGSLAAGDFAYVQETNLTAQAGDSIHLQTHFEGTSVGADKSCTFVDNYYTRNKDMLVPFYLRQDSYCTTAAVSKGHCSIKQTSNQNVSK